MGKLNSQSHITEMQGVHQMAHQFSVELEEGETFGNMDFLTEEPWRNSFAVALQDKTQVFKLDTPQLF